MTGLDSPLAAIAGAVRAGEVSALELTEAALARIAEHDGRSTPSSCATTSSSLQRYRTIEPARSRESRSW